MYDVIVVGAGSAGCVLAARLSADPRRRVLLLEAGGEAHSPWLHLPAGFARIFGDGRFNWSYFTEPEPELDGRQVYWPRGKVLGGSSAINAMVYLRGHASDFDGWTQAGNPGWSWREVLPYFIRSERFDGGPLAGHGQEGELEVSGPALRHPSSRAFLDAAGAVGAPTAGDLNDGALASAGFLHFTIGRGRRASSATAFLAPARRRPNLRVVTGAHVLGLVRDGRRVTGVAWAGRGGEAQASARLVVLCAGAINTPQILMLSGFGPAGHLRQAGVEVAADLPGVGGSLQDHFYVVGDAPVRPAASMNRDLRWPGLAWQALRYALNRRGALALGASQASAFLRSRPGLAAPDLQLNFTPLSYAISPTGAVSVDARPGVTIGVAHLKPTSRGAVTLAGPDPRAAPRLRANYLATEEDRAAVVAGMRWVNRIWAEPAMAALRDPRAAPGRPEDDDALLARARATGGSLFHPVGTCRMGPEADDVTDHRLRVRGVPGLRVADASIMPTIVSGNTNAAAIMIGEKAADLIAEDLGASRL